MCIGSARAAPIPPPPAPIQQAAPPPPPQRTDNAVKRARQIERNRASLARGRAATLLTAGADLGEANRTGKTLLGQ